MVDSAVTLRPVRSVDLNIFFSHQADPVASRLAAFEARDRAAHHAHWNDILRHADVVARAILVGNSVVGNVVSWMTAEGRAVGYWIGREHWGKGIATRALTLLLAEIDERPLIAFVAAHNKGSIRVLEKCGFVRREGEASRVDEGGVEEWVYERMA